MKMRGPISGAALPSWGAVGCEVRLPLQNRRWDLASHRSWLPPTPRCPLPFGSFG